MWKFWGLYYHNYLFISPFINITRFPKILSNGEILSPSTLKTP